MQRVEGGTKSLNLHSLTPGWQILVTLHKNADYHTDLEIFSLPLLSTG